MRGGVIGLARDTLHRETPITSSSTGIMAKMDRQQFPPCGTRDRRFFDMSDTPMRHHALDRLRASMMLLGVVFHAAVNYCALPVGEYFFKDDSTSLVFDIGVYFIHCFRMPIFFVMSGFFGALVYERRGETGFVANRTKRILIPFAVAWAVVFPACTLIVLCGFHKIEYGTLGVDPSLMRKYSHEGVPFITTTYLWFLHYLLWLYVLALATCRVVRRLPPGVRAQLLARTFYLSSSAVGLALLSLPLLIACSFYRDGAVEATGSFVPDLPQTIYYGTFFAWGWLLFHWPAFFTQVKARTVRHVICGAAAFCAALFFELLRIRVHEASHVVAQVGVTLAYTAATWAWTLGLMGVYLRVFDRFSPLWRYLSDAAYWIYLTHMMITSATAVLLYGLPLGAFAKFSINCVAAFGISLIIYDRWVRGTFVGRWLNGRVQSPGLPPTTPNLSLLEN